MAPIYEAQCRTCTNLDTFITSIDKRNDSQECTRCGGISQRVFSTCADTKEFIAYSVKGREVRTRGQEARGDKRARKSDVRDSGWFRQFKKEYKDKQKQPTGQRKYETLGKAAK